MIVDGEYKGDIYSPPANSAFRRSKRGQESFFPVFSFLGQEKLGSKTGNLQTTDMINPTGPPGNYYFADYILQISPY